MRRSLLYTTVALVSAFGVGCSDGAMPTDPGAAAASDAAQLGRKAPSPLAPTSQLLVTGLEELQGSTVGPGGALFVTAPLTGSIWRVDPNTGAVALFASGLPARNPMFFFVGSGVVDVAFLDGTAYALVTGVGPDLDARDDIVGIYRMDGPSSFTVIADLGAFSLANPPEPDFFVPTGYQYAIESYRGGFLVTDGHHNRVLRVTRDGEITELIAFGNVVPTGITVSGNSIHVAQAGPIPHEPEDGRIVVFGAMSSDETVVAAGAPLLVDVEFGRGRTLFALSQGDWEGPFEGAPAEPNTGALLQVDGEGTFRVVADDLDRPTSLEIIDNTAYVVTIDGEIWKLENIAGPPFGGA